MYHQNLMRDQLSLMPRAARRRGRPDLNPGRDFKDFERISVERQQRMERWREVSSLMMPNRLAFEDTKQPGQSKQKPVDSYPGHALQRGVGNVISALFPPERTWFEILAGRDIPREQEDAVNEALEGYRDLVFDAISRSQFSSELNSMMLDVFCSMGAMRVERGQSEDFPITVRAIPLNELYPIGGPGGDVVGMMRKYECEVGSIVSEFSGPGRTVTLPEAMAEKAKTDPAHKVCLLEVSRTLKGIGQRVTIYAFEGKHVLMDYVGSDPDEPSPWVVTRWSREAGAMYGRGPADRALETVRLLNEVKETDAKAMKRRLDPPMAVDVDSGINPHTLRLQPHAIVPYSSKQLQGAPPFQAIPDGGNLAYQQVTVQELKEQIDEMLFSSRTLPPVTDSHQMTAAEIRVRWMQRLREEGVDFGLLNREFGLGFIERVVWILRGWGQIPPMLTVNGKRFKIRYAGPLSTAQDSDDATNVLSFVADVVATVGEEAANDGIRMEDVAAVVGDKRNVPQSLLRTDAEKQERMQVKAQLLAAQAQMQMQGQAPPAAA